MPPPGTQPPMPGMPPAALFPQMQGQMPGGIPMPMPPQAYGQMQMPQPMALQQPMGMQMQMQQPMALPQQMGMQQAMGQMGYPQMNPDGSFAGFYQPNMQMGYPPGMQPGGLPYPGVEKPGKRGSLWEQHSYLDDIARFQAWVLSKLERVFHERGKALKICVPSAAFAVFFIIIAVWMVHEVTSDNADATRRECRVLLTRSVKLPNAPVYRPTVHCIIIGETKERVVTRFRDPAEFEVNLEKSQEYLDRYCDGCNLPCYQFDDGVVQLDAASYTSVWSYIIVAILVLSAVVCCCSWVSSGVFACCSPLITVTLQA